MRIGIIGSGNIGATAARRFVDAGHQVAIANSRGPEALTELTEELGDHAQPATPEEPPHSASSCSWPSRSAATASCRARRPARS